MSDERDERIGKVAAALLSMQRHSWEQGVAAQAFWELGEREVALKLARAAAARSLADGRVGMIGDLFAATDPAAIGEVMLRGGELAGGEALARSASELLEWLLHRAPRSRDGVLYHRIDVRQIWVDSFYMAPPFLAAAGHFGEAVRQIEGFKQVLFDEKQRLLSHIWDDALGAFTRRAFWGVGNGWALAGTARVLELLPAAMVAERRRLVDFVNALVDGCAAHLRADGLFHDVIDDASSFVETNLSQMLSYTLYRGIDGGWIDPARTALAERLRKAVYAQVDAHGYVQGVCAAPTFDRPGTAPEGQAFFLLMEAAARASKSPAGAG